MDTSEAGTAKPGDPIFEQRVSELVQQVERMVRESGDPTGFDAAEWVNCWINSQVPALGFKTPASYMVTAEGQELVSNLLARSQSGAYS